MGDLLWPTYDGPGRPRRRSRPCRWPTVACRARPTSSSSGPPACGRTGSPCPCCRTANGGSSRRSVPSPSCWPTCTATPTCSTRSACAAPTGSPCWPRTATSSSPRPWRQSSPASPRRSTAACPGEHIAELLRRSGARVLVAAGPDLAPRSGRAHGASPSRPGSRPCSPCARPAGGAAEAELLPIDGVRVGHLSALAAEQPHDAFVGEAPSATDLAALFHTGGTTGTPKLAAHTHANEVSDAWMIAANGLLDDGAVVFAALPLFHVNALLVTLLAPLFKGQRVVWAGPLGYRDTGAVRHFWKVVERYRVSYDERRAHRVLRPRRPPRRRRHQQPPIRRRRRLPPAAGGPGRGSSPQPASGWSRVTA